MDLGVFYLFDLQEAQSLNLYASIPLISTIGGFISKALTSCFLDLFADIIIPLQQPSCGLEEREREETNASLSSKKKKMLLYLGILGFY
jgi:hypothetical protein